MRARVRALEDATFELTLESDAGAREIRGESCEVVADAAALIYAMTIDPNVVARIAAAEPGDTDVAGDTAASIAAVDLASRLEGPRPRAGARTRPVPLIGSMVSAAPTARDDERRAVEAQASDDAAERSDIRAVTAPVLDDAADGPTWAFGAGAVGDAGLLPGVSVGAAAHAGLELDALRVEIRAMIAPAREARLDNHETARGAVSFVGGEARACAVALRAAAIELGPCAGVTAGAIQAEGRGVSSPGSSSAPFFAVSAGGSAALPIADWLALRADLAAIVPITRPEFVIDGIEGVVHEPSVVGARLAIGAEVRLQ
jgi:hypothetical protein